MNFGTQGNSGLQVPLEKLSNGIVLDLNKEANKTIRNIKVGLRWKQVKVGKEADLDVSAIAKHNGKPHDIGDIVFYGNAQNRNLPCWRYAEYSGDNRIGSNTEEDCEYIKFNLDEVPRGIDSIDIITTIYNAPNSPGKQVLGIVESVVSLIDQDTNEVIKEYRLSESHAMDTAVILGSLDYDNRAGTWVFVGKDKGILGDLNTILASY